MRHIRTPSELYHHGIKGQKWGVRNGPPYPLGIGQKSSSEKMVGSKRSNTYHRRSDKLRKFLGMPTKREIAFIKRLIKNGYIKSQDDIDEALGRGEIKSDSVEVDGATDLKIRDAILGMGKILEEDLDNHSYITTVRLSGDRETQAMISRDGNKIEIIAYGREGLIKQNLADKTVEKLKTAIEKSVDVSKLK